MSNNIHETVKPLSELRVCQSTGKFKLTNRISGFQLDSQSIRIFLLERKTKKVRDFVPKLLSPESTTIQELAETLGVLVSIVPTADNNRRTNNCSRSFEFWY